MNVELAQQQVRAHWDRQPCDSETSDKKHLSGAFFLDVERQRYALQPHILETLSKVDWTDKSVLEIGAGLGTDGRRIIRAGAKYTGINIDRGSTLAAARAFQVFATPGLILEMDARALHFPDNSFDVVYSFGVLQHIPEVKRAVSEIARVLRPGGDFIFMVYNRSSINYALEIRILRRLGLRLLALPGVITLLSWLGLPRAKLRRHLELYRERGMPTDEEWLSRNTNGPDYPYCRVYGAAEAEELLHQFDIVSNEVRFFDYRHWGVIGRLLPEGIRKALGRHWGWHRIVHARKCTVGHRGRNYGVAA